MRTFTYALKNGANLANHQGKSWMKTAEKKNCCASDKQAGEITVTFQCPVQFFFLCGGTSRSRKRKSGGGQNPVGLGRESRAAERGRTIGEETRSGHYRVWDFGRVCVKRRRTRAVRRGSPELLRWQNNNKQTEIDCLQGRSALGGVAGCLDGGGGGEEADKGAT